MLPIIKLYISCAIPKVRVRASFAFISQNRWSVANGGFGWDIAGATNNYNPADGACPLQYEGDGVSQ